MQKWYPKTLHSPEQQSTIPRLSTLMKPDSAQLGVYGPEVFFSVKTQQRSSNAIPTQSCTVKATESIFSIQI